MADVSSRRTRAFVSYSHADAEHLTRLHVHLAPYARQGKVDVWDDTRIRPGMRWKEEIEAAIAQAKVAILLVSADFLASEFIASDEVPPLLEAAEREGTLIVPVILSPSGFLRSKLARYQALNAPSDPLIDMPRGKQEAIWAKLAEYVADVLPPAASDRADIVPTQPRNDPSESKEPVAVPSKVEAASQPIREPTPAHAPLDSLLAICRGHRGFVFGVAWAPDGTCLASAGDDGTIRLWDADRGKLLYTYEGHTVTVSALAWAPDSSCLASASYDETVRLWGVGSGRLLRTYEGHTGLVLGVAWSPDGKRLASAGDDQTVRLWDAASRKFLCDYKGHTSAVLDVAWAPDSARLASASLDKTVQVWSAG